MPTCTDAERKILDKALVSKAVSISVTELQVAKFREEHSDLFESLVCQEIGQRRQRQRASALYYAVVAAAGKLFLNDVCQEASEEADRREQAEKP